MKKILITNHFLAGFSGSEIACLDIASEFIILGYEVVIGTFKYDQPLMQIIEKLNVTVVNLKEKKIEGFFDIIWAHHFTTLDSCFIDHDITYGKIVFSSLSPYAPLETPPVYIDKIDIFAANSNETKDKLISMGIEKDDIYLLPNPIKSDFFKVNKETNLKLKKIAIVSNHVPKELRALKDISNENGLEIDFYGKEDKYTFINKDILIKYDVIITIGRTVQYSLAIGIPVYCYDHFGGDGYILKSNVMESSNYNFSGRYNKKRYSPQELFSDIINNYNSSLKDLEFLKSFARENYCLSTHIKDILQKESNKKTKYNSTLLLNIIKRQREYYNLARNSKIAKLVYLLQKIKNIFDRRIIRMKSLFRQL